MILLLHVSIAPQYLVIFQFYFRYDGATVSIMLADKWKTMNQEQKQQFYTEADHLKTLHQQQHPNYK